MSSGGMIPPPVTRTCSSPRLTTAADAPYLDCAYKLQEYAGLARRKRSEGKASWPGRKQVYRRLDADGRFDGDLLTLESDPTDGQALILPVMRRGERVGSAESLSTIRERLASQLRCLPDGVKRLRDPAPYEVRVSAAVEALAAEVDHRSH